MFEKSSESLLINEGLPQKEVFSSPDIQIEFIPSAHPAQKDVSSNEWPSATFDMVQEGQYDVLTVDSIRPQFGGESDTIPIRDLAAYKEKDSFLYVIAADLLLSKQGLPKSISAEQAEEIFDAIQSLDESFALDRVGTSSGKYQSILADINQQHEIAVWTEGGVGAIVALGSAAYLFRKGMRNKRSDQESDIFSVLNTPISRRKFLQLSGISLAGIVGASLLAKTTAYRRACTHDFYNLSDRETAIQLGKFANTVLRPLFYESKSFEFRNARMALATIDYSRRLIDQGKLEKVKSGLVLGFSHSTLGTYPGVNWNETLEVGEKRLLNTMKNLNFEIIEAVVKDCPEIPGEIFYLAMKNICSLYGAYTFEQTGISGPVTFSEKNMERELYVQAIDKALKHQINTVYFHGEKVIQ
jgi:hypothetical protein